MTPEPGFMSPRFRPIFGFHRYLETLEEILREGNKHASPLLAGTPPPTHARRTFGSRTSRALKSTSQGTRAVAPPATRARNRRGSAEARPARRREKNARLRPSRRDGRRTRAMATMTTTRLATTRVECDDAMDVDDACADRTTEEIIVAAYRRDADAVASALRRCSPATTADMSLSRAAAVKLLGEDVYLGSHSWSTQEDFPVMYFAGARSSRPRPGRARVSPARPHAQIAHTTAAVFCFFPRNFSFCRVTSPRTVGPGAGTRVASRRASPATRRPAIREPAAAPDDLPARVPRDRGRAWMPRAFASRVRSEKKRHGSSGAPRGAPDGNPAGGRYFARPRLSSRRGSDFVKPFRFFFSFSLDFFFSSASAPRRPLRDF